MPGGVAGIAWELGVLRGIQDVDPALQASIAAADVESRNLEPQADEHARSTLGHVKVVRTHGEW